jgi:predicted amidohydrolase YtcJ
LLRNGAKLSFGSNTIPIDPMYGIRSAMESEYVRQRITFEEVLKAYTFDSAASLAIEQMCGSLEPA